MYKHFFKPLFDFIIALIGLPFFILLFIPIAIAIKINDGGPIFYCGKRLGRNGKPFRMYKFRSMKVNAPDIRLSDGSTYNAEDDDRVTKVGRFLRKTSLDEIPQLLNVLLFQMSFIGPRPDPIDWLEKYPEDERDFLKLRPGITGYNQAYFRNSADGNEKIRNDNYYARHISFWFEIKIFFKSFIVVIKKENINVTENRIENGTETMESNDAFQSEELLAESEELGEISDDTGMGVDDSVASETDERRTVDDSESDEQSNGGEII